MTLTNSIVSGNGTLYDYSGGGGVFNNNSGTLTLTNTTVSGNGAGNGGGGGIRNSGDLTLTNSTISGNGASGAGGGIRNGGYRIVTITNSTISGNSANSGGGLSQSGGTMTLARSLVSGNAASIGAEIYGLVIADNFNLFGHSGLTDAQRSLASTPARTISPLPRTAPGPRPSVLFSTPPWPTTAGPRIPTHSWPAARPSMRWTRGVHRPWPTSGGSAAPKGLTAISELSRACSPGLPISRSA